MKILFVSNQNPNFHNTNYYRQRALEALGHTVTFFEVNRYVFPRRLHQWWPFLVKVDRMLMNIGLLAVHERERPDLCLCVGGHTVLPATVAKIRSRGTPVALWTTDPPEPYYFPNIAAAAPFYTEVFCAGSEAVDILKAVPGVKPHWLVFCCDAKIHAPVELTASERSKYGRDISFVGSYYPNRAEILSGLVDCRLGIWGPLWDREKRYPCLKPFIENGPVDVDVWKKIYQAAAMVVVIHYQDGHNPCHQASPKIFEVMACGAFILCDEQKDVRMLFNDGEHLVFFKDGADLKEKAAFYLSRPEVRQKIATAGRAKVLAEHTYIRRFEQMFNIMGLKK
ncbi:MAG: glycosyltransferase [Candidatus Omnitrophica bacterium]|nr:glycosyltransferase [Candidatus Omnitrophota bacterium]